VFKSNNNKDAIHDNCVQSVLFRFG